MIYISYEDYTDLISGETGNIFAQLYISTLKKQRELLIFW
jgi:hypothetical protein